MEGALDRFVAAQDPVLAQVEAELAAGRKATHWMWFVFPQLRGLGRSDTARRYGIADRDEAAAYLAHPVLGPRLARHARLLLLHRGSDATDILGPVDAAKLRSSMTLFAALPGADPAFAQVLDTFFGGAPCPATQAMIAA